MSIEVKNEHQLIQLSDQYKLAFKKVDYDHFLELENDIRKSVFTFDDYYESMTSLNRKIEWLSIRKLLLEMGDEDDIYYDEHGKPHFVNTNAHLSISHSKESIAVSIHNSQPHGIDLQFLTNKIKRIRGKFLREEEMQELKDSSVEELSVYWSMKEALFKLNGKKDIYLKENIRISKLKYHKDRFTAIGELFGIDNPIMVKMEARLLKDYVLAYTLIP